MKTGAEPLAHEFGKRVAALRKELEELSGERISQETLAHMAGLHRTHIGKIERGEVNPTVLIAYKIADVLEVDPVELLGGLPYKPVNQKKRRT